jgi:ABC-type transport system involved in multi-copper enzyme maturation permease subunit
MQGTFWAALHNEFSKFARQKFPYLGMVAVILLAIFWVRGIRQIASPGTEMNAFSLIVKGAISAVTSFIPLFAVIFASVLVASETDSGTYRNILSRPIRRTTFLTAKILFAFSYVFLLVVLYIVVAVPVTLSQYSFGPITDHGEVIYSLPRIVRVCAIAFLLTLIPLFAIVSYGILVSTAAKSLTSALGIGVGLLVAIEPLKHLIRWGNWNLSTYILTTYLDTALNIADQAASGFDYEWLPRGLWASDLSWGLMLSLGGIGIFLGASYAIFLRRDLNFS